MKTIKRILGVATLTAVMAVGATQIFDAPQAKAETNCQAAYNYYASRCCIEIPSFPPDKCNNFYNDAVAACGAAVPRCE